MLKKLRVLAFFICLSLTLIACGQKKIPIGFTDKSYELGCKALEFMDEYNNGEMDKDEVADHLEKIEGAIKNLEDDSETSDDVSSYCLNMRIYISSFQTELVKPVGYEVSDTYSVADKMRELLEK